MKRFIFCMMLILLIPIIVWAWPACFMVGGDTGITGGGPATPGDDYADITWFYRQETDDVSGYVDFGSTNGTYDYAVDGDSDYGTIYGSYSITTGSALFGTYGGDCDGSWDRITFVNGNEVIGDVGGVAFWIEYQSAPTAYAKHFNFYHDNNEYFNIYVNTAVDEIGAKFAGNGVENFVGTNSANLTYTGTDKYYIVYKWDVPNDTHGIWVYNSAGTLLDSDEDVETNLGELNTTTTDTFRIGNGTTYAMDVYQDKFIITNDYDRDLHAMRDYTTWNSGDPE